MLRRKPIVGAITLADVRQRRDELIRDNQAHNVAPERIHGFEFALEDALAKAAQEGGEPRQRRIEFRADINPGEIQRFVVVLR